MNKKNKNNNYLFFKLYKYVKENSFIKKYINIKMVILEHFLPTGNFIPDFKIEYFNLDWLLSFFSFNTDLYMKLLNFIDLLLILIVLFFIVLFIKFTISLMGKQPNIEPKQNQKIVDNTNNNLLTDGNDNNDNNDNRDNIGSVVVTTAMLATSRSEGNNNEPGPSEQNTLSGFYLEDLAYVKNELRKEIHSFYDSLMKNNHRFCASKRELLDDQKLNDLAWISCFRKQQNPEFYFNSKILAQLYIASFDRQWLGLGVNWGSYEDMQAKINSVPKDRLDSIIAPKYKYIYRNLSREQFRCYCDMLNYMESKHEERKS